MPGDRGGEHSLTDVVNSQFRGRPDVPKGMKLHPCHRIDRDTSGVMVFAKGQPSRDAMMDLFRNKQVRKVYVAFVHGRVRPREGEIDLPVREGNEQKASLTRYRVREQRTRFAIVDVMPQTGRTSQIRLHFKGIGHPLVGENKFAYRKVLRSSSNAPRCMPPNWRLYIRLRGAEVVISAPLSTDMKNSTKPSNT